MRRRGARLEERGRKVRGAEKMGFTPNLRGAGVAPVTRQVAVLSIRVDLPPGGKAYHFKKEGREAALTARIVGRSWEGGAMSLLKILALAAVFVCSLRLGWLRTEDLSRTSGAVRVGLLLLLVGALLSNAALSLIILGVVGAFAWTTRG